MKYLTIVLSMTIVLCLAVVAAVSFHSVSEIHYLKSFYPGHFTVSDAAYASVVELVKVLLVAFPLVLIVIVCLSLLRLLNQSKK